MSDDAYRELQKHLDQMPIGFPATESGVELRVLKHIFTPEEAKIATKLSWEFEPSETIYNRFDKNEISIEELKEKLDNIAKKGGLYYKNVGDETYYANAPLVVGMHELQIKRLTEEFVEDMVQYGREGFGTELFRTGISQLRVIPIERSITREGYTATYDDVREIIKNTDGPIGVTQCICRKTQEIRGQPCSTTSLDETCMVLGFVAQINIDQGWARPISKEEALEILRRNEEAGLVLQPGNTQRPDFLCSCCGCCCGFLSGLKLLPRPVDLFHTNHYVQIDPELCIGCETCIERCQMDALRIMEGVSTVDLGRCIGCGNCVPTCPSEAIQLQKKEDEFIPLKTREALLKKIKSIKEQIGS
ncbi:MAG: 4Fe-4S binding protein [Candidatus Lokiarchaeia archaeon]